MQQDFYVFLLLFVAWAAIVFISRLCGTPYNITYESSGVTSLASLLLNLLYNVIEVGPSLQLTSSCFIQSNFWSQNVYWTIVSDLSGTQTNCISLHLSVYTNQNYYTQIMWKKYGESEMHAFYLFLFKHCNCAMMSE